jgi:hypothetical protein
LFQYAVGPAIVAATTHLHYLKPGENPWLESTVKELADKSGIPMPKLATVPNNTQTHSLLAEPPATPP